ncbi:hypothetical protein Vafri_17199 [Volvox africanus]|uniref:Glycerol-3-phosphate dehydrogenase [NAD(+)] n=1 Tax=Volvox africanus TaxID=51714 RepID=A0A8J4BJS5_9CHLO|nr:hypothetical protein Vafri_17199 [Volvox africanus]
MPGEAAKLLQPHQVMVSCSKGISLASLETVEELLEGLVPPQFRSRLAYLSGPSFAAEVAAGQPTAVTVAAKDDQLAARVQALLSNPRFRCYRSTDVVGVEIAGALKNVLAIACGISDGLGFGNNARAALITRGLYEITKLAVARGANPLTMSGLAGMGDLVLTCTGDLSRNRTVGLRLGRGERLTDIQASMGGAVAEGVPTAVAIRTLSRKLGVECPIMEGIHRVIHEGANAQKVVTEVMSRELKPEVAPDIIKGVIVNGSSTNLLEVLAAAGPPHTPAVAEAPPLPPPPPALEMVALKEAAATAVESTKSILVEGGSSGERAEGRERAEVAMRPATVAVMAAGAGAVLGAAVVLIVSRWRRV